MKAKIVLLAAVTLAGCTYSKDARIPWADPLVFDAEAPPPTR